MLLIHNITVDGILSSTLGSALNPSRLPAAPINHYDALSLLGDTSCFSQNPHVETTHFTFVIMD
jgi:hypothetical protein